MSGTPSEPPSRRQLPALTLATVLVAMAVLTGCASDQEADQDSVQAPDPAAERALEETALQVGEAFAHRDRGEAQRTEDWLPELRGDYETASGVQVGRGGLADDGLVLLTHAATKTYKCIAVTDAADVAGESVNIAQMSTGEPRC